MEHRVPGRASGFRGRDKTMINHPNRSKLFTVLNASGTVEARGCSVAEAAQTVMNYDGYAFEIRPGDTKFGGFDLWRSDGSYASTRGARHMTKSVIFSLIADRASAEAEIYKQVITHADWWRGCEVMNDEEYDVCMAEFAAENEGEAE